MNLHRPNGRPAPGTKTGRVWEICDSLLLKDGVIPSGRKVAEIYAAEGGKWNTALTQYSHWKRDHEAAGGKNLGRDRNPGHLSVGRDGRLLIPADLRGAMKLGEDGLVTARVDDGVLILMSPDTAIRKAQELVRRYIPEGVSLVDELIAERRSEAARESGQ